MLAALVDRTTLTLTYEEMLDEFSTPPASAFEVQVGESTVRLVPTNPVEIVGGGQAVALAAAALRDVEVDVHGITGVAFTNKPTGDCATIGGHVKVTLPFSQTATVSGTPRIELSPAFGPGGETRYAGLVSGNGSTKLVFRYTLVEGDD